MDADRYLLALVRYIHLNPVRASMVTDPRDYPWSSHRAYLGVPFPPWLHIEPVLAVLGTRADAALTAYQRFMNEMPDDSERDAITPGARPGRPARARTETPAQANAHGQCGAPRSLDAIAADVAAEHGVAMEHVLSKRRHPALVTARREIARRALLEGAANLSQVARHINRSPSALSGLLRARS